MPEGRLGKVSPKIFEENHGLRQAWFGAWYPKVKKEKHQRLAKIESNQTKNKLHLAADSQHF